MSSFALYTNVDKFIQWIDAPTADLSKTMMDSLESCGIMSSSAGLIQNGKNATAVQWPWAVFVFNENFLAKFGDETYHDFEVGSLITAQHVLTDALHVSKENNGTRIPIAMNKLKFYFGVTNIDDFASSNSLVLDGAEQIFLHPELGKIDSLKFANLAIVKLKTRVTFSQFISPVCLSSFSGDPYSLTGRFAYAVGMGYSETGKTKERRYSPMRIRDKERCDTDYGYSLGTAKDKRDRYFCAGGDMNSIACWSDHPLYLKQNGKWFLHAFLQVAYNKDKGCRADMPVLYEIAGPYYRWILNVTKSF